MTYSQVAPPIGGNTGPALKRPETLLALIVISAISALSSIVSAIYVFISVDSIAESHSMYMLENYPDELGVNELLDVTGGSTPADAKAALEDMGFWNDLVSSMGATLIFKGMFLIFFAVFLLLWTLLAINKGATWARVLITIFAVLSQLGHLGVIADVSPPLMQTLSYIGSATAVVAIVLCWLPPNNRYAKARKLAR